MLREIEKSGRKLPDASPRFEDMLACELSLTVGSKAVVIPGGAVKRFRIAAYGYGFEASVTFCISAELVEDPLAASFVTRDPITARLTVKACESNLPIEQATLTLNGMVTDKRVVESAAELREGMPIVLRKYTIELFDPAQVLWRKHRPNDLQAEVTLAKAMAAHTAGVTLETDWPLLDEKHDVVCLGLGHDDHPASFYDFVIWLVASNDGVFEYNATDNKYRIAKAKSATGEPTLLIADDVERAVITFPETVRSQANVLNSFTERAQTTPIAREDALKGLRRDTLVTTAIASEAERRVKLEQSLDRPAEPGVRMDLVAVPRMDVRPGLLAKLDKDSWPSTLWVTDQEYRIAGVFMEGVAHAESAADSADLEEAAGTFMMSMSLRLESKRHPICLLPAFVEPRYPIFAEGKVVSPGGEDDERTWMVIDGEKDALPFQRVDIPLWNKVIPVPFDPSHLPGHFFFPPYKNQRVLVALELHRARIARFVDWAENARLPKETQGNQIVFGRNKINGSWLQHAYKDNKPELTILRKYQGDECTILLQEGGAVLSVQEKEFQGKSEPKFDLTMEVQAAQAQVTSGVQQGTSEVSGKLQGGIGEVSGNIDTSVGKLGGELEQVEGAINTAISAVQAELEGLVTAVNETVEQVQGVVDGAKNEIMDAVLK